eukprot:TRINITY_DN3656_c0_g1_i1.p1 TRINITY_DN3656_c0_g1~~TRINITY_DN3656_c0_g1_i1.p1  ORF type:complete len:233 (-),score=2.65 TRINITY_DN3656_c0_g1_i1:219-917(-)
MDSVEPTLGLVGAPEAPTGPDIVNHLECLTLAPDEGSSSPSNSLAKDDGNICAICHEGIVLQELGFVKGCEHTYCINCILQWASYKSYPWCPQCRLPFDSLYLYKQLDGSVCDFMVEETVCLLLRAPWYKPVEFEFSTIEAEPPIDVEYYEEDDEDYYRNTLRIGNRRWGENGYVRHGRMEARPAAATRASHRASQQKPKEGPSMGRRAKRAQRRGVADGGGSSSAQTSAGR